MSQMEHCAPLNRQSIRWRRQNSSVAFSNFLQRMTNVGCPGFAAQLHPYHIVVFLGFFWFFFLFSISIIQHFGKCLPFFQWLPGVGDTLFGVSNGPFGQQS